MTRQSLVVTLLLVVMGSLAMGTPSLDITPNGIKTNNHLGMNPGTPDGREGGEDIATAVIIASLPFDDTGNTSDNVNDYDAVCPYSGSTAPDVVYSYTPTTDEYIQVDLCGSGYDTKTYIFDSALNLVDCNDDAYEDDICGEYVSLIEIAALNAGETYYIVIDGYGQDAGDYVLNVTTTFPISPCILDVEDDEGEPELVDGYIDSFNNGCRSGGFGQNFSHLVGDGNGELVYGGQSGWYILADGVMSREADWFTIIVGDNGLVEWTLDAEQETYGFLVGPNDCSNVGVIDSILVGPCAPLTLTIEGMPGEVIWLWVGPSAFEPPVGFLGNEYMYQSQFTGLMEGTVATDRISFEGLKSLYR